jgi:hypothetical protein
MEIALVLTLTKTIVHRSAKSVSSPGSRSTILSNIKLFSLLPAFKFNKSEVEFLKKNKKNKNVWTWPKFCIL